MLCDVHERRARDRNVLRTCAWAALLAAAAAANAPAQEPGAGLIARDVCVYEISAYGQQVNARALFRSTLPATIISQRPAAPRDRANEPMPIGLLTFEGTPAEDVDVMLEFKSGRFVAHWPPGNHRSQRLLWAKLNINADPTDSPRLSPGHWLNRVFEAPRLFAHSESRSSRGLLYDAEIQHQPQLKVTFVENQYRLENTGQFAVHDFTLYLPAADGQGFKIVAADEAPGVGKPEQKTDAGAAPDPETVFEAPMPAEGEAKPAGDAQPPKEGTPPAAAEPAAPAAEKPAPVAAAAAAADVVVEEEALVEPPAAAAEAAAKPAAENPGTPATGAPADPAASGQKFTPLADVQAEPVAAAAALEPWRAKLSALGLGAPEVEHVMGILTHSALRPDAAVAIYRLDAQTLEALLPLEIAPLPETVVRVGLVVLRDCDPQLETSVAELIKQLGDADWKTRNAAQARLKEMSQAAVPKLTEAANNPDVEIAYRAEQLLEELQNPQNR